jgi:NADH-quinone oxidoreductase subunit J
MNVEIVLFLIISIMTLGSALMVVMARNLVYMALWLVLALFGVAILFGTLAAGFLAVTQVVVYIGAIAILMIFAIMLTRRTAKENGTQYNQNWRWALLVAVLFFAILLGILTSWTGMTTTAPALDPRANYVVDLGKALVDPNAYLLPFELASILLLAALVGAIYVAWDRRTA